MRGVIRASNKKGIEGYKAIGAKILVDYSDFPKIMYESHPPKFYLELS